MVVVDDLGGNVFLGVKLTLLTSALICFVGAQLSEHRPPPDRVFDVLFFRFQLFKSFLLFCVVAHDEKAAIRSPCCTTSALDQSAHVHDAIEADDQIARGHI